MEVRGATDDTWTETGVTWNNQPAFGSVLDTQTLSSGTTNVWYNWNVTSFVQGQFAGDKTVSLLVKPVTENSADTTAPSYGFDAKEFGSNAPVLQVNTQASASSVANVSFFYRYSADNTNWGAWTQTGAADTSAPYTTTFSFPAGAGYYEFFSVATDNLGGVEPAPAFAQTGVHYQPAIGQVQTIDFTQPASVPVGSSFTLSATASSGLPVTFSSQTATVCAVAGDVVTTVGAGTCTVLARQAGDVGYWQPVSTTRSFTVQALAQTINFGTLGDRVLGSGNFGLSASATSNLPVQFASLTVSVCSVSGATVTLVATGTCQISATQPGDAVYAAAPSVVRSFAITPTGTVGGGGDDGDVPLPDWAVVLLALCMLGAMHRVSRRAPPAFGA